MYSRSINDAILRLINFTSGLNSVICLIVSATRSCHTRTVSKKKHTATQAHVYVVRHQSPCLHDAHKCRVQRELAVRPHRLNNTALVQHRDRHGEVAPGVLEGSVEREHVRARDAWLPGRFLDDVESLRATQRVNDALQGADAGAPCPILMHGLIGVLHLDLIDQLVERHALLVVELHQNNCLQGRDVDVFPSPVKVRADSGGPLREDPRQLRAQQVRSVCFVVCRSGDTPWCFRATVCSRFESGPCNRPAALGCGSSC